MFYLHLITVHSLVCMCFASYNAGDWSRVYEHLRHVSARVSDVMTASNKYIIFYTYFRLIQAHQ
jgi:hypothetical protein